MKYFLRLVFIFIAIFIAGIFLEVKFPSLFNLSGNTSVLPASVKVQTANKQNDQVLSSDGAVKLSVKKTGSSYSFFVSNANNTNSKLVFTKTLSSKDEISIPQNTFSPSNKYFFLKEKVGLSSDVLVFRASGSVFSNGQQYLTPISLSREKNLKYSITDITGWDDPTLLHVKTTGPNFWFDVETSSFIQLAR